MRKRRWDGRRRFRDEELLNGGNQKHAIGLGYYSSHADFLRLEFDLLRPMHGVHQDWGIRKKAGDLASCLETIHDRHHQIENDEIRFQFLRPGDRLRPIVDVNNFPRPGALQQVAQGVFNRRTVLSDQNSDGHANRQAGRVAP